MLAAYRAANFRGPQNCINKIFQEKIDGAGILYHSVPLTRERKCFWISNHPPDYILWQLLGLHPQRPARTSLEELTALPQTHTVPKNATSTLSALWPSGFGPLGLNENDPTALLTNRNAMAGPVVDPVCAPLWFSNLLASCFNGVSEWESFYRCGVTNVVNLPV